MHCKICGIESMPKAVVLECVRCLIKIKESVFRYMTTLIILFMKNADSSLVLDVIV